MTLTIKTASIEVSSRVDRSAEKLFEARAPLSSQQRLATELAQASLDLGDGRSYALLRAAQVLLIERWYDEEPEVEMTRFLERLDMAIERAISLLVGGDPKNARPVKFSEYLSGLGNR